MWFVYWVYKHCLLADLLQRKCSSQLDYVLALCAWLVCVCVFGVCCAPVSDTVCVALCVLPSSASLGLQQQWYDEQRVVQPYASPCQQLVVSLAHPAWPWLPSSRSWYIYIYIYMALKTRPRSSALPVWGAYLLSASSTFLFHIYALLIVC